VFDSSVEMFKLVIPELTNYVPKKNNAGLSKPFEVL
jgi:hypothetical protein